MESPPSIEPTTSRDKRVVVFSLLLAAATLAFFNPIIRNQFLDFDDQAYIVKNIHIQDGLTWAAVKWSFTTFYYANWHPLTWLSHALDYQFFQLNPVGHHYISLLLHTANVVLLFLLLQRATGLTWPSLAVAALFALHPVNVESIAWAAERKNVLSMLFFLLSLRAYDRYARRGSRRLYWASTLLFALGLMAKPQIVTLPFLLLLWDYWPLQRMFAGSAANDFTEVCPPRSFPYLVWEKLPFFILSVADSVVTVLAQHAGNTVRTLLEVPLSVRLENVPVAYVRYIGKAFWPSPLVPMYPRPENSLPMWQVVGSAALLVLLSALCIRFRDRRYLLVGWLWFLGTLVPMIGIITVGDQAMADRYAYASFIGLFIVVVWGLRELAARLGVHGRWLAACATFVMLILGALGSFTHRQIGYWHDNETLWRYTLSVTERNYVAHNSLALALSDQGRADEAILEFRAGRALHKYPHAQVLSLAWYELQAGHPQEAIEECKSILNDPADAGYPADVMIKGAASSEMGQAYLQLRQYDQAAQSFQQALRINPDDGMALMGTGILALARGQADGAADLFMHAVKVAPNDVNVLLFAQALRHAGRVAEADSAYAQFQRVSSDPAQAQNAAAQFLSFAGLKPL
jgi:tetratricopeptide (TPR) repeat protein